MRKIFLFESNKDITSLIRNAIQNEFNDEVKNLFSVEEAIKEISMGDYDLLIVRNKIQSEDNIVHKFLKSISDIKINSKLISIGEINVQHHALIGQLPDKFKMSDLIQLVKLAFDQSAIAGENDYLEIKMEILQLLKKTNFNLFNRMRSPGKDDQFLIKVAKNSDEKEIRLLAEKGVKSLFIEKKNRLQFTDDLVAQVSRGINIDFNGHETLIKSGEEVYRLARKLLSSKGTNEISYRLINCLADEMIGNLRKSQNNLDEYIYASIQHTSSYSFKHLNLIGIFLYVSLPHLDMMEEKKDSYLENFIYATFFHDIILEQEGMAEIHTKKDLQDSLFDENEKNLIRDHAKLASELLEKFPGSNKETIKIVREHHGVPSGVGFTDRKVGSIIGASVFFDVIHDFVELFLNFPPDGTLETILQKLEERYHLSIYKEYLSVLKNGIVETFKNEN